MSVTITTGTFVAARKPVAGRLGWWIGKVFKIDRNGFCTAEILLADDMTNLAPRSFRNGSRLEDRVVVGFRTMKEAFYYRKKRKRAFEYKLRQKVEEN